LQSVCINLMQVYSGTDQGHSLHPQLHPAGFEEIAIIRHTAAIDHKLLSSKL